jgi:hypothetical protein
VTKHEDGSLALIVNFAHRAGRFATVATIELIPVGECIAKACKSSIFTSQPCRFG